MLNSVCLSLALSLVAGTVYAKGNSYEVKTTETKAQNAVVIKGKVKIEKAAETIGQILGKVGAYLGKKGVEPAGAPFTRTFEFKDGELDFEAGFPVAGPVAGEGEIIATELPKALVATTLHVGPQANSERAYEAIHAWMAKNGKAPAGAPWESYLSDEKTPAAKQKMQVFFPVK